MNASKYMLRISILFIFGIVIQNYAEFNSFLLLSIWLGLLILLLFTAIERSAYYRFRSLISVQIYALFFLGGMLALGSSSPGFYKSHYAKQLLPGDQIIARIIEYQPGQKDFNKAILEVEQVISGSTIKSVDGSLLSYIEKGEKAIIVGEKIVFRPRISAIENKGNPGEFDAEYYWKSKGITEMVFLRNNEFLSLATEEVKAPFFDRLRSYLKNELRTNLSPEASSLAIALSLGDKGGLSQEVRDSFSNAGAMHVLAVSGLHVGILLGIVQWIFFQIKLLRKRNTYVLCAIIILWFFALLTGLAPSVFRATLMFTVLGFGQLLGKRFFSLNALLVAAIFLLMLDARMLFDIGFQLSFLALLGITFFFQPISNLFVVRNYWINKLWEGTALGLAAQIGTIPVSLFYFHQFPNYFILTNLGLILVSGIALGSVLLFFIISKVPGLSDVLSQGIELIFASMSWFVKSIDQLPYSVARGFSLDLWEVLLAYGAIAFVIIAYRSQQLRAWNIALLVTFLSAVYFLNVRHLTEFKSETVVFNSPSPLVLYKEGGNNYFFHSTENSEELEKLDFIVSSYEKKYGGKSTYLFLGEEKMVELQRGNSVVFSVEQGVNALHVNKGNKTFTLPLNNDFINIHNDLVVVGSWSKNTEGLNKIDLKKGAIYL